MSRKNPDEAKLLRILAVMLNAPTNRFGKLEFYTDEARAAREELRLLAVKYSVAGDSATVMKQAAKVCRAVLGMDLLT